MSLTDTFKPQNVAKDRDDRGNELDLISDEVSRMPPASSVNTSPNDQQLQEIDDQQDVRIAQGELDSSVFDTIGSGLLNQNPNALPDDKADASVFDSIGSALDPEVKLDGNIFDSVGSGLGLSTSPVDPYALQEEPDHVAALMPKGIEPGSYSPDDLVTNDRLYNSILPHMIDRHGIKRINAASREEVVDMFLNNRRGVAMSGNSVRVLAEVDYVSGISEDKEKLRNAGVAYTIYENMAGITSDEYGWGELAQSSWDVVRGVVLDPVNVFTMGIGKVVSGLTAKTGTELIKRHITKQIQKEFAAGSSKEVIMKKSQNMYNLAARVAERSTLRSIEKSTEAYAHPAFKKLATKSALHEIGAVTAAEAAAGGAAELLYQGTLMDTGVIGEYNPASVGLAALGSVLMGGIAAARVGTRGWSKQGLAHQEIKNPDLTDVKKEFMGSYREFIDRVAAEQNVVTDVASSTKTALDATKTSDANLTDFFNEVLYGRNNSKGETEFIGMSEALRTSGWNYYDRFTGDRFFNALTDQVRKVIKKKDIDFLIEHYSTPQGNKLSSSSFTDVKGNPLKNRNPTPREFTDHMVRNISESASSLNKLSQASNKMTKEPDLKTTEGVEEVVKNGIIDTSYSKPSVLDEFIGAKSQAAMTGVMDWQDRYVRSLVTHYGTSQLNVIGWGISSGMGSASDILQAVAHLGIGGMKSATGGDASRHYSHASGLIKSNLNRVRIMLDPDMSQRSFDSYMSKATQAFERINKTQGGGVDADYSVEKILGRGFVGGKVDDIIDVSQFLTFVRFQDSLTKSQEGLFQLDKAFRLKYNKSFDEFLKWDKAAEMMADPAHMKLEKDVVRKIMRHTFSETYSGTDKIGRVAGVLENARRIPFVGMMIPFGKFMNNTVAFTARNAPGVNVLLKAFGGKFDDASYGELFANAAVTGGLIASFTQIAQQNEEKGLGIYQVENPDGTITNEEFKYPKNLFMALGALMNIKYVKKEPVPDELLERIGSEYFFGSATRGITKSGEQILEVLKGFLQDEAQSSKDAASKFGATVGGQLIAGFTRPLQPVDMVAGLVFGIDQTPRNTREGNLLAGKSLAYTSNLAQILTGRFDMGDKVTATGGVAKSKLGVSFGSRIVQNTDTERVMYQLYEHTWDKGLAASVKDLAPEASSAYELRLFDEMEGIATAALQDPVWTSMSIEDKRKYWAEEVKLRTTRALIKLSQDFSHLPQNTFDSQIDLVTSVSADRIREGIRDMGYDKELNELTDYEIRLLKIKLDTADPLPDELPAFTLWGD